MQAAFDATPGAKRWLTFAELLRLATETERARLAAELTALDALFVEGIAVTSTDDALRLLRIVDDLYASPDAPTFHFTAAEPLARLFDPTGTAGLEAAVAEKFDRTRSRLAALCAVEPVLAHSPLS